ncbi:hypothetical protein QYE76_020811 [Lolium multiflorum]|uniref:Uncharacterized protein n=1 Tax=Lolium multiflorum TaxID=4521 RepID=A0AAD8R8G8_LOLMU|nr:hypothetical protein QYE76_020811 [Lolium multiflorum]
MEDHHNPQAIRLRVSIGHAPGPSIDPKLAAAASWPVATNQTARITQNNVVHGQADDPWYIAYQDESTQWCSQRMDLEEKVANLGDELARKNPMIFELKRIVEEEKKNSELIRKEKLRVETDLAVFDQVVENLEHELKVMGEEKSRFI